VTTTVTCKRRKNTIKVSVLPPRFRYALFWFLSFSWFVDFSSVGNKSGGWVASGYYLVIIVEETGEGDGSAGAWWGRRRCGMVGPREEKRLLLAGE